jgi:flagellar biosynthesis GTPase FlhF
MLRFGLVSRRAALRLARQTLGLFALVMNNHSANHTLHALLRLEKKREEEREEEREERRRREKRREKREEERRRRKKKKKMLFTNPQSKPEHTLQYVSCLNDRSWNKCAPLGNERNLSANRSCSFCTSSSSIFCDEGRNPEEKQKQLD